MISSLKGPGEVVAEILMQRQVFAGSFLIVEGDDDSRFFRHRIHPRDCEIVIGGGKPAVVGGIKKLDTQAFAGALAAIDDDCDSLESALPFSANLVSTDTRDLETLLLRAGALGKVLAEFGDAARIRAFETSKGQSVSDALLQLALPFGRLRWVSRRLARAADFKQLTPRRFVRESGWSLDEASLLKAACAQGLAGSVAELNQHLLALPPADPWRVCHGHDLVDILGIGLRDALAAREPGRDRLGAALRLAVEAPELEATRLWSDIRDWESRTPPFRVLRPRTS